MENTDINNEEKMVMTAFGEMSESDRNSELKMLKSSWGMYERTKAEAKEKRENAVDKNGNKVYSEKSTAKTMELLNTMQEDIKAKYVALGGNPEDLKKNDNNRRNKKISKDKSELFKKILEKEKMNLKEDLSKKEDENNKDEFEDLYMEPISEKEGVDNELSYFSEEKNIEEDENKKISIGEIHSEVPNSMGGKIKYDVIPLPSKGRCYKSKISKIPVAYLTAYDENMIISPNMYKDGTFIDYILKSKIMTDEIDPNDMLPGDRDAIILWLRASGYGPEFPVSAVDNESGQRFDSIVDLSKLSYKNFNLKSDANGYFDFTLPFSKHEIKFKFLTYGDIKKLEETEKFEDKKILRSKALEMSKNIDEFIENDGDIERDMINKLRDASKNLKEYSKLENDDDITLFTHAVTDRLAASIVAINGVTNRKYIEEYVMYMNVKDSTALRKYIVENEPGVDFNIKVERPESLGGGSVDMFLSLDQYIFLTLA